MAHTQRHSFGSFYDPLITMDGDYSWPPRPASEPVLGSGELISLETDHHPQHSSQNFPPNPTFDRFSDEATMPHSSGHDHTAGNAGFITEANGFNQNVFQSDVNNQVVSFASSEQYYLLIFYLSFTIITTFRLSPPISRCSHTSALPGIFSFQKT